MTSLEQRPSLEDRIRAATRAAASTVPDDGAPPLQLREQQRRTHRLPTGLRHIRSISSIWPTWPSPTRLAAPLAAAAAVVAVIAASLAVADRSHSPEESDGLTGAPRYYLDLTSPDSAGTSLGADPGQRAIIRDTFSGATVATIRPPRPFNAFVMASAAADDRTFVLAAQTVSRSAPVPCRPTRLFLARLSPANHHASLTALPVREFGATSQVDAIALSPDGTRLAVAFEPGQRCVSGAVTSAKRGRHSWSEEVSVYTLPRRTVKTWWSFLQWNNSGGSVIQNAMSWAADRTLAFNFPASEIRPSTQGIRLLNTDTAGGNLLADSQSAVSWFALGSGIHSILSILKPPPGRWAWSGYGVLTPDGKTVVAPIRRTLRRAGGTGAAFGEFSASTGNMVRVLWPEKVWRPPNLVPYYSVVWTNSSGSVLVVAAPATRGDNTATYSVYGVLRGDRFTPIPGAPESDVLAVVF